MIMNSDKSWELGTSQRNFRISEYKYKKTTLNSSGEKQVIYNGRKLRLTRVILFQNSSLKMWVLEENERMSLE